MAASRGPYAVREKLPPAEDLLPLVSTSCRYVADESPLVDVDEGAAAELAASLDLAELAGESAATSRFGFPLRFGSQREEINFVAVRHLLDFGSGHDAALLKNGDKPADMIVRFGLMGMHLGGKIDAEAMIGMSLHDISRSFCIPVDRDVEVSPAVYESRPHPLRPFADAIRQVLTGTGSALRGLQLPDLAAVVYEAVGAEPREDGEPGSAAALVRRLAQSFEHLDDRAGGACFFRKAQLLAADLRFRFGQTDRRFAFGDAGRLTAAPGNATVAFLRARGVIRVRDEALAGDLKRGKRLPAGSDREVALRAAAVAAVDAVAAAVRARAGDGPAPLVCDVDAHLESLATADDGAASPERHRTDNTVHY